jgi:hypothetical protein
MPRHDLRDTTAALVGLYESYAADGGRIRVEDLLSAASAVCGEACIVAAGEFDPEKHDFMPGSAVLSDRVNVILANDASNWAGAGESVFGLIRTGALASGYAEGQFPAPDDVFRAFASGIATKDGPGWGFVPLTVPVEHQPRVQPIRAAYKLRGPVRKVLREDTAEPHDWPAITALAVVSELSRVRDAIDHGVALTLVLETINGMAKTAPMTDEAFRNAGSSKT